MEDAYGVPRSPSSYFDEEEAIAQDYEMQELGCQQHMEQPVPDDYGNAESGTEDEREYDEETIEDGLALGEQIALGSVAAGSSDGDFTLPWQPNMFQYRKRPEQVGANPQRKSQPT